MVHRASTKSLLQPSVFGSSHSPRQDSVIDSDSGAVVLAFPPICQRKSLFTSLTGDDAASGHIIPSFGGCISTAGSSFAGTAICGVNTGGGLAETGEPETRGLCATSGFGGGAPGGKGSRNPTGGLTH